MRYDAWFAEPATIELTTELQLEVTFACAAQYVDSQIHIEAQGSIILAIQ